jgi:hypothetical protein
LILAMIAGDCCASACEVRHLINASPCNVHGEMRVAEFDGDTFPYAATGAGYNGNTVRHGACLSE